MAFLAGEVRRASDLNDAFVGGVVARGNRQSVSTSTSTTSATSGQGVLRLSCPLRSGRLYRIEALEFGVYSSAAATVGAQLTATVDGTTPTAASTLLTFGQRIVPTGSEVQTLSLNRLYVPGSDLTLGLLLSIWRVAWSGNVQVYGASTWPIELLVTDLGVDTGDVGVDI